MKRNLKWILIAVVLIVVVAISLLSSPKLRTTMFIHSYSDLIENSMSVENGVPAPNTLLIGFKSVNSWEGEHGMTEFIIMTLGDTYYGCYYSPDDVPLAFQNVDVELIPDGENQWTWSAEGDNRGTTSKIKDHWYYFKASF